MKKILPSVLLILVLFTKTYSQLAPGCSSAVAFCAGTSATGLNFPNTTTPNNPQTPRYSCLGSQPNPTWYYLRISVAGNLTFTISQTTGPNNTGTGLDVDFIAWGPFSAPTCGSTSLDTTHEVGCSYSVNATETFSITNAQVGQYYMVLITNYRNQPGFITLAQTSGSGATDCDIVCPLTVTGGGLSDCAYTTLAAKYLNSSATQSTFQWTFNGVNIPAPSGIGTTTVITTPPLGTINSLGPLGTNTSNPQIFTAGNYCVTARSPGCSSTQSAVCTTINPGLPIAYNPPTDISVCTGSTFNLTQNTNVMLNGLPGGAGQYVVRYNINQANALANTGHIPRTGTNNQTIFQGTENQIIYATITDNTNQKCLTVAQFRLHFITCAFATTNSGPICAGGTFNLNATDPGIGTVVFTWTGPNGYTATGASQTNIPAPTGTPPFNYVCTATPTTGTALTSTTTLTVNPIPVATATPVSNSICSGATTDIPLVSSVAGTTFAWTVPSNTVGAINGSGSNIAQTLTTSTAGTVSYTITPTANGCPGSPIVSTITVNPIPVATAVPTTICSGATSNIVLSSTPTGASFAWTPFQTDVQGATAASGTSIAQTLTAQGNLPGTVDYTITPTLNGCPGSPIHSIITVNPIPVAIASPVSTSICSGSTTNIPLSSLVFGTTFAWTVVQTNVTGAINGNGVSIAQTLTATTANPGSVVYTITPTANGCIGLPITVTINVTPLPTATISYIGTPFCSTLTTGQTVTLTGTAAYTGGVFSSTTGLIIDATSGAITPSTSTAGNYVVTYTIAASAGCSVVTATSNIVITKDPTAAISYPGSPFCSTLTTGQLVTLTGTDAYTGGSYSSTTGLTIDATTGAITPSSSTPGNYVVTYTIPASVGCSTVTTTTNIVITKSPTASISYIGTPFCSTLTSSQTVTLTGTEAYTGGVFIFKTSVM